MLVNVDDNTKYTFIPKSEWINGIEKGECINDNDVFKTFTATLQTTGELIICTDAKKQDTFCEKVTRESYQEYRTFIENRNIAKEKWVYNILDGIAEQDRILYRDQQIVIVPNYLWNGTNIKKMHILTFPTDKSLRSIRDLNASHIPLLKHCYDQTIDTIKQTYNYDNNIIKAFIHYAPSTYHMHIHFALISNDECNSSVVYSHELSNVIFNLSIKSDYYQAIDMIKRI